MISALLLAVAVYLVAGKDVVEKVRAWIAARAGSVDPRNVAAAAIFVAALVSWSWRQPSDAPAPVPAPPDAFTLRGRFVGPTAADDAAMLSALLAELADCIQQDGERKDGPRLRTGVAFDDLRIAAREARMRGESLGARQPQVRDAVHLFLDSAVGTSGGPVTPESRAVWVSAYRDLSRAAAEAVR